MQRESALILPVPDAELLLVDWRERYDPAAAVGVPAHITLLYPFVPPPLGDVVLDDLATLFNAVDAFTVRFHRLRRFAQTLYVEPDDGGCIKSIIAEVTRRWPEHKPYGGRYDDVVPHLTVADNKPQQLLNDIERAVAPHLPLETRLFEAWLIVSDEAGRWRRQGVFPLKARTLGSH